MSLVPNDANAARRDLRALLLELSTDLGIDVEKVPHSFDSDPLIQLARSALASRKKVDAESKQELRAALGFVLNKISQPSEADELFLAGIAEAEYDGDAAYFHYLRAHQILRPRGEWGAVREEVQRAIDLGQMGRRVRAWAQKSLAHSLFHLGYHEQARAAVHEGLSMRVNEANPALLGVLANVAKTTGDEKEALRLNKRARRLHQVRRDELGVAQTDARLAAWHLLDRNWEPALAILDEVRPVYYRILVLEELAAIDNNRGIALANLGHFEEARPAYEGACRLHAEAGNLARAQETLRALALNYERAGEVDLALAYMHLAAEMSADQGLASQEFRARAEMLDIMAKHRTSLRAAPYVLARTYAVLDEAAASLPKDKLLLFTHATAALGRAGASVPRREQEPKPRDFPKAAAIHQARSFAKASMTPHLEAALRDQITSALPQKWQPRVEGLVGFLMGFVGGWFRNGDYQQEFLISQGNAKHHLRELRAAGLIDQQGIKKGAKYHLQFHAEQSLFMDPVGTAV
jgi:tetratricopeptide (TPR) repeat protein